jgi:DNA-binding ferritin-like protein (Dps family)
MYQHAVNGQSDVFALAHDDVPDLVKEVRRLRGVLELIETAVVDGRATLDVWDIMNIAERALAGKEDVLG